VGGKEEPGKQSKRLDQFDRRKGKTRIRKNHRNKERFSAGSGKRRKKNGAEAGKGLIISPKQTLVG